MKTNPQFDQGAQDFMLNLFPDSQLDPNKKRYLATCMNCGAKKKLWFYSEMPHQGGCFSCEIKWKSVFEHGYRNDFKLVEKDHFTPMERLVFSYRKSTGNTHRYSEKVIKEFGLKVVKIQKKDKTAFYENIAWPSNNSIGYIKHLNFDGRWVSVDSKSREGQLFLNLDKIKKQSIKESEFTFHFLAGEPDLCAFWENMGFHGIAPLDGESFASRLKREDIEFLHNRHIVIYWDNDAAGYRGGKLLAKKIKLYQKVKSLRVVDLSKLGLDGGQDIDDYFKSGGTKERLFEEIEKTADFNGNVFEADSELSRVRNKDKRPENPESTLDEDILEKLWNIMNLPGAKRELLLTRILEAQGIFPERGFISQYKNEFKKLTQEMETLRFLAYDLEVEHAIKSSYIKQIKRMSEFESPKFFYYEDGIYKYLKETDIDVMSDEIARRLSPPDDRSTFSKIRKLAKEDFSIRLNECETVDFENCNDYINFSNGVYSLEKKKIYKHSPDFLLTYKLPAKFNPSAKCENFNRALKMSFKNEEDKREIVKGYYYLISGKRDHDKAFWFHGNGNDGKTVFALLARALVGEDRTSSVPLEELSKSHGTAPLFGKVLNISEEVPKNYQMQDAIWKRVTGGALIHGDPKYKEQVSFINKALFIIPSNDLPRSSDTSHGYKRRFQIFPFKRIKEQDVIRNFHKILESEIDGISYKLLTEGRKYFEEDGGFVETENSRNQLEEMLSKNPVIKYWQNVYNMAQEKIGEELKEDLKLFKEKGFSEEDATNKAKLRTKDNWITSPNDIDKIEEWTIVQKYKHRVKGDILIVNTNKHYALYKESIKHDEVNAVSYMNFCKGSSDFLIDKLKNVYSDICKVEIWKKDALDPMSEKGKTISLLQFIKE